MDALQHDYGLGADELKQLRAAFGLFDITQVGAIDPAELRAVLIGVGVEAKDPTVFGMLTDLANREGQALTFQEFVTLFASGGVTSATGAVLETPESIFRAFRLFDKDLKGSVNVENLERVCRELGEDVTKAEMEEMIARADSDRDGEVSLEDFQNILTRRLTR